MIATTVDIQQVTVPADRVREKHHDPASLAESMAAHGLINPITVRTDLTLVSGYHRLAAAKLLGWTQIDARIADVDEVDAELMEIAENLARHDLTVWEQSKHIARQEVLMREKGERAERGDNRFSRPATVAGLAEPRKTPELAASAGMSERTWQTRAKTGARITPAVAAVLNDIDTDSCSLPDSTTQLNYLAGITDPDDQLEIATRVADGNARDVWDASKQMKQARKTQQHTDQVRSSLVTQAVIEQADALEWLDRQPETDLLLTDPPYMTDIENIGEFARSWLPLALSKVKRTGRAYVFVGAYPEELHAYTSVHMPTQLLVWTYRNTIGPSTSTRYKLNWQAILYYQGEDAPPLNTDSLVEKFTVQDVNAPDGRLGDRYHAWQKPLALAERFVVHATQEGDSVMDPFACTGTFLLAAAKLGRHGRGCEIDPAHVDIAVERGCERG